MSQNAANVWIVLIFFCACLVSCGDNDLIDALRCKTWPAFKECQP
jgi:hypothetical protein